MTFEIWSEGTNIDYFIKRLIEQCSPGPWFVLIFGWGKMQTNQKRTNAQMWKMNNFCLVDPHQKSASTKYLGAIFKLRTNEKHTKKNHTN